MTEIFEDDEPEVWTFAEYLPQYCLEKAQIAPDELSREGWLKLKAMLEEDKA